MNSVTSLFSSHAQSGSPDHQIATASNPNFFTRWVPTPIAKLFNKKEEPKPPLPQRSITQILPSKETLRQVAEGTMHTIHLAKKVLCASYFLYRQIPSFSQSERLSSWMGAVGSLGAGAEVADAFCSILRNPEVKPNPEGLKERLDYYASARVGTSTDSQHFFKANKVKVD